MDFDDYHLNEADNPFLGPCSDYESSSSQRGVLTDSYDQSNHSSIFSSSSQTGRAKKEELSDRFIPCRTGIDSEAYFMNPDTKLSESPDSCDSGNSPSKTNYQNLLESQLFGEETPDNEFNCLTERDFGSDNLNNMGSSGAATQNRVSKRKKKNILRFKADKKKATKNKENAFMSTIDQDTQGQVKPLRKVAKLPFKVLDAPQLKDDFYLNLLDWSSKNVLAVGLGSAVYIWSACNSKVTKLCESEPENPITSVCWSQRGSYLSVGLQDGTTQVWDSNKMELIRTFGSHTGRVSACAWNGSTIATGSRDR